MFPVSSYQFLYWPFSEKDRVGCPELLFPLALLWAFPAERQWLWEGSFALVNSFLCLPACEFQVHWDPYAFKKHNKDLLPLFCMNFTGGHTSGLAHFLIKLIIWHFMRYYLNNLMACNACKHLTIFHNIIYDIIIPFLSLTSYYSSIIQGYS